tara:strand:- start:3 stop:512 length:510 start_codon:yes stop_codon:yes gene_type:complete
MYEKKVFRSNLKKVDYKKFSLSSENKIFISTLIKEKKICTYIPMDSELDINIFFDSYLEIQTTFVDNDELDVCLLKEPFVFNKLKIKEPQNIEISKETDIFFIPGLAFSRSGVRLGRGKGLYDKLLAKYPNSLKVGICSSKNLYDYIPQEPHDILMDYVLTENDNLKIH